MFMMEIFLEPAIKNTLTISEADLKKRKGMIKFKRLTAGEKYSLENAFVVLIFGELFMGDKKEIQGCFSIPGTATVEGPAKFYFSSLKMLEE